MKHSVVVLIALIVHLCQSQTDDIQFHQQLQNTHNNIPIKPFLAFVPAIDDDYQIVYTQIYQKADQRFNRVVPVDQYVKQTKSYIQPQKIVPAQKQQSVKKPQQKQSAISKKKEKKPAINKAKPISQKKQDTLPLNNVNSIPKLNNQKLKPEFKIHQINKPSEIVHYSFQKSQKGESKNPQNSISNAGSTNSPKLNDQKNSEDITIQPLIPEDKPSKEQNLVPINTNPMKQQRKSQKSQQYSEQFIKNQVRIQILRRERQSNLTIFRYVTFGLVILALSTVLCLKKQKKKPVRYTPIDLQQETFVV